MNHCVFRILGLALICLHANAASIAAASPGFDPESFGIWVSATFGKTYKPGISYSGMGMIVVQRDQVVMERTFGFADYTQKQEIYPSRTRFLIGSISKTFVGLAIAQLLEDGHIQSIDDPVARYLRRVKLDDEIRICDLLTHSAGFEQRVRDVSTIRLIPMPVAADEVHRIRPLLVRPRASLVSYSNYSTGLLAAMVEDITRQSIETYEEQRIWVPLGMKSTHFQKGLNLEPDVAGAFHPDSNGKMTRSFFLPFHPFYWPVGGIGSTLEDMSRYLRFHLAAVRGGDSPVLSAARHRELRSCLRTNHPDVGGFGFQMMSFEWNGETVFGHGGTWPVYESMMLIFPERDLGIFYSISGPVAIGNLKANFLLLKHLLGPYRPKRPVLMLAESELQEYAGLYQPTIRAYQGVEAILSFLGQGNVERVIIRDKGLMIGGDGPFLPIGNDVFWCERADVTPSNPFGSPIFAFKRDENGTVKYMVHHEGLAPMEKIRPVDSPEWRIRVIGFLKYALFGGLLALFWPAKTGFDRAAKSAAFLPGPALVLLFPVITWYHGAGGLGAYLMQGRQARLISAVMLGNLTAASAVVLTCAAILWSFRRDTPMPVWVRVHGVCVAIVALAAALILHSMHCVGYSVR
jgi:CubicO group peptidase (beta-lactamase class C family)